ncbi:MAG: hypothetical protein J6Y19_08510 [Kiritimatiellae bacterium]|nr:hypothetical protein [Kiritimatiellia bacterium]
MKHPRNLLLSLTAGFLLAGCSTGPYVPPEWPNPAGNGDYTRAETIAAERRLAAALLSDPMFARHHAAKTQQRGGTPFLQVANFVNGTTERASLAMLRDDMEQLLRDSGSFFISGDADACDYILRGTYRSVADGYRVTHKLTLTLHDVAADMVVWSGSDEIAKQ